MSLGFDAEVASSSCHAGIRTSEMPPLAGPWRGRQGIYNSTDGHPLSMMALVRGPC